jgi:hypothetical protein
MRGYQISDIRYPKTLQMQVRTYEERDLDELRRIHAAQGFGYAFPDLSNPLFLTKLVLVADNNLAGMGRSSAAPLRSNTPDAARGQGIIGAALLRLTAEAYLLLDPSAGSPRERWQSLLTLHAATAQEAVGRGLEDVHAWLPPEIAKKFGKRLVRLGWVRDDTWTPYCKRLR